MLVEVLVLTDHQVDLQLIQSQKALAACALADRKDEGESVDQLQGFLVFLQTKQAGDFDVEQKVVVLRVQLAAECFLDAFQFLDNLFPRVSAFIRKVLIV